MNDIPSIFGSLVFNDKAMQEKLPEAIYKALQKTIQNGEPLDIKIANAVASAMKDWAIERGATHYTHWFQPMTGITAEKHDSFITPTTEGNIIMEFSGKELIKGESDASSFPNGGIRATFEARGYTAWDPTSYAFLKEGLLCIPTAFCSYGGEVLDKKTPLLRSMNLLNKHALRILKLFGNNDVKRITPVVGAEQEYFLIKNDYYEKRKDLKFCGRTIFGAKPPKGQELEDHYFGALKPKVLEFMSDLDLELWKMGVPAKTEHNEAAPSQHELAPVYETANMATDHNQIIMETMKRIATKHGLTCLLHEKPFKGINGSGKHNNWSMSTDTGVNLLDPGSSPYENAQFLLILTAVLRAVDEHQDLLRISVASAGNDHRLGGNEAPPSIISVYLGDELTDVVNSLLNGNKYSKKEKVEIKIGIDTLPQFSKDNSDRNRTSPFAFTGNKFEFRMLGSAFSISCTNIIINTIIADVLDKFATELENTDDFNKTLKELIVGNLKKHKRIIFNGNNYSQEWVDEAEKRGLLNYKTTVDALPLYIDKKNIELFTKHCIYTEKEVRSRYEILMENYSKVINIEALTMIDMTRKDIIPAVEKYINNLSETGINKKKLSEKISTIFEVSMVEKLSSLLMDLYIKVEKLENEIAEVKNINGITATAKFYGKTIFVTMEELRTTADTLETLTDANLWPLPSYAELLFSV